jgi:hypothetical protein
LKTKTKKASKLKRTTNLKPPSLSVIDACRDENLFRPYFGKHYKSFAKWRVLLRAIYGVPLTSDWQREVYRHCTGRDPDKINPDGYQTSLIIAGRRSGKSKIAAVIGTYAAALAGLESKLSVGETGMVAIISVKKSQAKVVRDYCRALLDPPMLSAEIIRERQRDVFTLRNGNRIDLLASDMRTTRGHTLLACIIDEICHFGLEDTSRVRTEKMMVNSVQPALMTTGGKLVCISTPWGKQGWSYETFQKYWGKDSSRNILVWNASSKFMHPKLSQKFLDRMKDEDLANYNCEFLAQFRDDVAAFISLDQVEALVVKGRQENVPKPGIKYNAFVDLSGGRGDASALAIGHRDDKKMIVLDALDWHPSPHDPYSVVATMAKRLNEWGVRKVIGDAYAAEFASRAFQDCGITYEKCSLTASALYSEILPIICTKGIELLDQPGNRMVKQFASLESRTRSGGKPAIGHPPKQHDDLANAVAGVAFACNTKKFVFGSAGF